jgi:chromosomal replication initiation ATPase DnaA
MKAAVVPIYPDQLIESFSALDLETQQWLIELAGIKQKPRSINNMRRMSGTQQVSVQKFRVLKAVCTNLNLAPVEMKSPGHLRIYVEGRFIAYNLLYQNGYRLESIARIFRRDHSTIIYGLDQHKDLMVTNDRYKKKYSLVVNSIKENLQEEFIS